MKDGPPSLLTKSINRVLKPNGAHKRTKMPGTTPIRAKKHLTKKNPDGLPIFY